jgi:Spy/CpxP family protein refolding chaperone
MSDEVSVKAVFSVRHSMSLITHSLKLKPLKTCTARPVVRLASWLAGLRLHSLLCPMRPGKFHLTSLEIRQMQLTRHEKIVGGLALAGTMALSGIVGFAQQGTRRALRRRQRPRRVGPGRTRRPQKGGGMRGGGLGGASPRSLNLTDAQKAQMEQITARYRETAKAGRQQRQGRGAQRRLRRFQRRHVQRSRGSRGGAGESQRAGRTRSGARAHDVGNCTPC